MSIDTTAPAATSTLPDVSGVPIDQLSASDDSWLRRAVDRIRDEAVAGPDSAVAAFNSSI